MARVTVEDCVRKIPNRFSLILLSAHRARRLGDGEPPQIERDNDKNPVVALREIADGGIDTDELREEFIMRLCRHSAESEEEASDTDTESVSDAREVMADEIDAFTKAPEASAEPDVPADMPEDTPVEPDVPADVPEDTPAEPDEPSDIPPDTPSDTSNETDA